MRLAWIFRGSAVDSQVDWPKNADGHGGVLGQSPSGGTAGVFSKILCIQNEADSPEMSFDAH